MPQNATETKKAQELLLCSHWNCANFLIKERCLESPIMQFDPDYCYISMSYMYIWYILFWYKMIHDSVFLTSFMYSSCLFVFSSKNLSLIVPIYVIKFKSLFSGCMLISFCCLFDSFCISKLICNKLCLRDSCFLNLCNHYDLNLCILHDITLYMLLKTVLFWIFFKDFFLQLLHLIQLLLI